MNTFLDAMAYRFLARVAAYTPQMHYDLRRQMSGEMPALLFRSRLKFPYWFALILFRLTDLYWLVRYGS